MPLQLRQVSSRKGTKYTQFQLAAKKPRVELTLKQKSEIVNEAKKMGFQVGKMGRLTYVNQALLARTYNVTSKTIKRTLLSAEKVKHQMMSSLGQSKHKRSIKFIAIEEKIVAFVSLLRNRTKPLPVILSIVKEYAEQVAQNLGGKDFRASSGWWEKVRKRNGIGKSVKLHGEAGEVDCEQIKKKILEIQTLLEKYDPEQIYNWDETGLYFRSIPNATYTAPNEVRKRTRGTKAQKFSKCGLSMFTKWWFHCLQNMGFHDVYKWWFGFMMLTKWCVTKWW